MRISRRGSGSSSDGRLLVHVGAPKTGTTYLQNVLWRNAEALAAHGVLLPGKGVASHHQAALRLRQASFVEQPTGQGTSWQDLADEGHGWRGDVLVSSELLAWTGKPEVDGALSTWPHREVHLVMTLRDLARQLPAVWQEEVKNRRTTSWPDFWQQAVAAGAEEGGPGGIWGGQDPRQVLGRWARDIPAERVHVVTVPPAGHGPDLLWRRFCEVLGVPADEFDTEVRGRNPGLGLAEAELLRQVNLQLPDSFVWRSYSRLVKHGLAESALASGEGGKIALPDEARPALARRAAEIDAYLRESGVHVVGDLADLRVHETGRGEPVATTPADAELADAGVRAVVELLGRAEASRHRVVRLRRELQGRTPAGRRRAVRAKVRGWARTIAPEPLRRVVRRLRR